MTCVVLGCGKKKVSREAWDARVETAWAALWDRLGVDPEAELEPGEEQMCIPAADVPDYPELWELYTGNLYRARLAYARALGGPDFILSAFFGCRRANFRGAFPYDRVLDAKTSKEERALFRSRALRAVLEETVPGEEVIVLASAAYCEGWTVDLAREGRVVETPLRGLQMGEQLRWLKLQTGILTVDYAALETRVIDTLTPAQRKALGLKT